MVFSCKRCGACCRGYWITILPSERVAMAKELGISEKQFTEKFTQLLLQLFPAPASLQKGLVVSADELPKKVLKKLEKKFGVPQSSFIVLPSIALKRRNNVCVLLGKESRCAAHNSKPGQCSLFPFISLAENPDFVSLYGFCAGLMAKGIAPRDWKEKVLKHQLDFSNHFKGISEKGFSKEWKFWPKKGVVLLKTEKICSVSEKEFFKAIEKFA